jgi:hypothetical protein
LRKPHDRTSRAGGTAQHNQYRRQTVNVLLWFLQVILAAHTAIGAVWKVSNSEQTVPSLSAIPHGVWLALIGIEALCVFGLLLPAVSKPLAIAAPIAAVVIAVEMLAFCGVHFASGAGNHGQLIYWLVVAAFCAFIAYGRFVLKPF